MHQVNYIVNRILAGSKDTIWVLLLSQWYGVVSREKKVIHAPFCCCRYNYNYGYVSVFADTSQGDVNTSFIMWEQLMLPLSKMIFSAPWSLWLDEWGMGLLIFCNWPFSSDCCLGQTYSFGKRVRSLGCPRPSHTYNAETFYTSVRCQNPVRVGTHQLHLSQ